MYRELDGEQQVPSHLQLPMQRGSTLFKGGGHVQITTKWPQTDTEPTVSFLTSSAWRRGSDRHVAGIQASAYPQTRRVQVLYAVFNDAVLASVLSDGPI